MTISKNQFSVSNNRFYAERSAKIREFFYVVAVYHGAMVSGKALRFPGLCLILYLEVYKLAAVVAVITAAHYNFTGTDEKALSIR